MNFRISNVQIKYSEDGQLEAVQVYFIANEQDNSINMNGNIPLTAEEYAGNESVTALSGIIKQRVIERLQA
ncbi:hypothetical protein LS684_21120 (plasmid) [Cytobacillus spongiae]|uniref:hypothetical protein n=1 Tax=Cytobacillus spongiae TaxID=2901381 RepID=UPI001F25255B|nr:hypothetical protein [Cytobacillus spongiae]UII58126.1 hypothetical protein LS684_21120 [Cytobacillus spongiae]